MPCWEHEKPVGNVKVENTGRAIKVIWEEYADTLKPSMNIDDFVDFLSHRDEMDSLVRAAGKLSEKSFQKVWNNSEDAEYDNL